MPILVDDPDEGATFPISGQVVRPGGITPLTGTWRARIHTDVNAAITDGGTIRAGVEAVYDAGDGATMTLPAGDYLFMFLGDTDNPATKSPDVLGWYPYTVTGPATWGDVMTTPTLVPVTPADVALAEEARDEAIAARDEAVTAAESVYAIGTDNDTAVAGALTTNGSAARTAMNAAIGTGVSGKADQLVSGKGIPRTVNRADYASLAAAMAAVNTGGTVFYPDNTTWDEPATTIGLSLTLDARRATIRKSANGALFTITASSVRLAAGLTIDGNAPTFTGPGIVVAGNGTTGDLVVDANVINCDQWAVDIGLGAAQRAVFGKGMFSTRNKTANDAAMTAGSPVLTSPSAGFNSGDVGKYAFVRGALSAAQPTSYLLSKIVSVDSATQITLADNAGRTMVGEAIEAHFPAFRFGAEFAAGVTGDRHMVGTHTGGYLLADLGGVQTLVMVGTNSRGIIFSSASCAKVSASGSNRFATSGAPTIARGINHSLVGATFAGDLVAATDCSSSMIRGNVSGAVYDYGTDNDVQSQNGADGSRPFMPHTVDPRAMNTPSALNANQAVYLRVRGRGYVSKIAIHVGAQSGNICVGAYTNTGAGQAARPAVLKGTSGSVACPAPGYAEVALAAPVYVDDGDWLAVVADNVTATIYRGATNGFTSNFAKGVCAHQSSAFPLPATASPNVGSMFSIIMEGVA